METPEQLTARLKKLMNMDKRVLFMKGSPEKPQCGFSRQFVAILKERQVEFSHFDIYSDESVRQGEVQHQRIAEFRTDVTIPLQ